MDRRLIFPRFENPPEDYNKKYFDNMVNMLNVLMVALRSPGVGRQTTMTLTDLPTNDSGLEPGALFQVGGQVRISVTNIAYVQGLSGTGAVGTVTITTV
jgi:hypothetical protein